MSTLAATLESVKSTLLSVIVGADTLRAALKVLSSVAPPSVLGGKLARTFIACFDRQVWVGAQAGAVKMMVRVERAHAPGDGVHCFPWDRTNAIAKAIDPKNDIRVTFDDGEVVTFASDQRNGLRSTFNLATAKADGIALPSVAESASWSLPADALVLALDSAKVAMGGTRFNTDGVLLRATESGDVSVLATDGCQLAISTIQTFIDGPTGEAFIPSEAVKALRSVAIAEGDGLVSISMRTENVKVPVYQAESGRMDVTTLSVRADGIILEITCGSVSFPDLAAITSTTYDAQATFGNMAELVKACSGLVKVGDGCKILEIRSAGGRDGRVTLSVGETSVVVPNSSTYGKPFARSLDSALLLPYLKAVPKSGELILDAVSAPGKKPQEHCVRFHSAAGRHYMMPRIADKPKDATEPSITPDPYFVAPDVETTLKRRSEVKVGDRILAQWGIMPVVSMGLEHPTAYVFHGPDGLMISANPDLDDPRFKVIVEKAPTPAKARRSRAERIAEASPVAEAVAEPVAAPAEPVKVEPVAEPIATEPTRPASVKAAAMAPEATPDTYTPIRPVAEPSMNVVYDVLEHVKPGTRTSTTPGTWLVQHFATESQAREFAARCNQCVTVPGITFEVQAIDAESPDRHQPEADYHRSQRPSIGPAPISGGSPELAVDLSPGFPESVSPLSPGFPESATIVEIRDASYAIEHKPDGIDLTKLVSGEVHQCRWTPDGVADCTCPGFRFNGGCRHLCYAQSAGLIPSPAPVPVLPEPPATLPEPEMSSVHGIIAIGDRFRSDYANNVYEVVSVKGDRFQVKRVKPDGFPALAWNDETVFSWLAGAFDWMTRVPMLPEPAPADPCDIRPGHPEYTIEDEHARVRAIIDGAPILCYHLPESGPRRVEMLGWVVADHVSRLVEIQRDGQHGRDDSAGVGWTASLQWDAMPAEERDIFAEWVDAIGYDPTEDFAGLPADEQWDVFAECCITGSPIAFPVPPGPNPGPGADSTIFADQSRDFVAGTAEASPSPAIFLGCNVASGHDMRSHIGYNSDGREAVTLPPVLNTTTRQGVRHVVCESYPVDRVSSSDRVPPLSGGDGRVRLEPDRERGEKQPGLGSLDATPGIRQPERLPCRDALQAPGEQGPHPEGVQAGPGGVRRAEAPGDGMLPRPRPARHEQQPAQPPLGHEASQRTGPGPHGDRLAWFAPAGRETDGGRHPGDPRTGPFGRHSARDSSSVRDLDNPGRPDREPAEMEARRLSPPRFSDMQAEGVAVLQTDPIISRAPWSAIDLVGAHAMNTLPALSGGSDEASPGPKYASPGSIVLFWHCPACRKSGPVGAALPAARPEVSARALQNHRADSPNCPGVPDVGFPAWMPEDGTPGTIRLPVSGGSPELPEDCPCPECGGTGTSSAASTKASRSAWRNLIHLAESPDCPGESCLSLRSRLPVSGGSPELPEDCPCPECGGSGVAGGQCTEGGEETAPCDLCEGTGRYSPTELPEEEYDRLVAAATPSNERLRRMIRDRKPPEASDTLLDDLERLARQMQGDRPTQFEDSVALAMRKAYLEIRRLRWEIGQLQAKP